MKKYALLVLPVLLLVGAGCAAPQTAVVAPPAAPVVTTTPPPAPQPPVSPPKAAAFLPDSTSSAQAFSTVPANGDGNPYGVAFVPTGFPSSGKVSPGDVLVSNWNDTKIQGGGTTIVAISPAGKQSLFFQGKKGLGLTTALAVLKSGYVIAGNLPTADGTGATAKAGSLLILDHAGKLLTELTDAKLVDGPWDMTVNDTGMQVQAFVSNVLSGTVVRFDMVFGASGLTSHKGVVVASGYGHHTDPSAAVVGPTGLSYDKGTDTLLVASTVDNAIYSIAHAGNATTSAGMGTLVYKDDQHLHGPLALAAAPNGDLLVTNGDAINADSKQPSEMVEFTPAGTFVKQIPLDPAQGAAFGFAIAVDGGSARLAAVEDNTAKLLIWTLPLK